MRQELAPVQIHPDPARVEHDLALERDVRELEHELADGLLHAHAVQPAQPGRDLADAGHRRAPSEAFGRPLANDPHCAAQLAAARVVADDVGDSGALEHR